MTHTPPPAPKWLADAVLALVTTAYQTGWADAARSSTQAVHDKPLAPTPRRPLDTELAPAQRDRYLLTVQELAEYLNVPVRTIYGWRRRKNGDAGPKARRVGGQLRFDWRDIDEWLSQMA